MNFQLVHLGDSLGSLLIENFPYHRPKSAGKTSNWVVVVLVVM